MAGPRAAAWWRGLPWPLIRRAASRAATLYVLAALVVAPAVAGWAIASTAVHAEVGIAPTTLTLTTSGHSELRLGIAGAIAVPRSRGPLGVVATVDGPADPATASTDLASYVSPRMLQLYSGLFHDPERAIKDYVELLQRELWQRLLVGELVATAVAGSLLLVVRRAAAGRGWPTPRRAVPAVTVAVGLLVLSCGAGLLQLRVAGAGDVQDVDAYSLPALEGTPAAGATTNSPLLRLLLGAAVPKVQTLVARQERAVTDFRDRAEAGLRAQAGAVSVPRQDERAVLMQSDMHCNATMITVEERVRQLLQERYQGGQLAAMAITGDLTTNGTPAEGGCIRDEAAVAGKLPVVAVTGNHESTTSVQQMKDAGMTVLDGDPTTAGGITMLGARDPSRSELFGATRLRGSKTEEDVGNELYEAARDHRPDLVLVHEAHAAAPFVGTDDMATFLEGRGSATRAHDDGVRDLPASAVLYGHWHRSVTPRVVWNSDGTWTLVMELNTAGGAVDQPTVGHFSTPWTKPQQEASFPVLFLDKATGLVTGYQVFRFETDGNVTVEPRVEVGDLEALNSHRVPGSR